MQYRLSNIFSSPLAAIIDVTVLGALALWQGLSTLISADDWSKITGPHGLVFVLIIGLIVVWTKSVRDDAARERRHRESIKTQEEHFTSLLTLNAKTADDLKVLTVASTKAQINSTNAIISMDRNIIRLTNVIDDNARATQQQLAQLHNDNSDTRDTLDKKDNS
jgi:hypothetical protein